MNLDKTLREILRRLDEIDERLDATDVNVLRAYEFCQESIEALAELQADDLRRPDGVSAH